MIACARCGQESPQDSLHCVHCGTRLSGEEGPARTVIGMPALKPLGGAAGERKPGSLLAGLPALRTKTSSPLVSGEFSLKAPEGVDSPQKTVVGLPLFEGAVKVSEPVDAEAPTVGMPGVTDADLAAAEQATVAMQGLTDAQLTAEQATVAMQGLAQVAPAEVPAAPAAGKPAADKPAADKPAADKPAADKPPVTAVARGPRKDDPAHHPQRKDATAMRLGERRGGGMIWVAVVVVIAGAAAAAWYFLR